MYFSMPGFQRSLKLNFCVEHCDRLQSIAIAGHLILILFISYLI